MNCCSSRYLWHRWKAWSGPLASWRVWPAYRGPSMTMGNEEVAGELNGHITDTDMGIQCKWKWIGRTKPSDVYRDIQESKGKKKQSQVKYVQKSGWQDLDGNRECKRMWGIWWWDTERNTADKKSTKSKLTGAGCVIERVNNQMKSTTMSRELHLLLQTSKLRCNGVCISDCLERRVSKRRSFSRGSKGPDSLNER